jgi:hypothetical protein
MAIIGAVLNFSSLRAIRSYSPDWRRWTVIPGKSEGFRYTRCRAESKPEILVEPGWRTES